MQEQREIHGEIVREITAEQMQRVREQWHKPIVTELKVDGNIDPTFAALLEKQAAKGTVTMPKTQRMIWWCTARNCSETMCWSIEGHDQRQHWRNTGCHVLVPESRASEFTAGGQGVLADYLSTPEAAQANPQWTSDKYCEKPGYFFRGGCVVETQPCPPEMRAQSAAAFITRTQRAHQD